MLTRRKFITVTTAASVAASTLLQSEVNATAKEKPKGFELLILATNWGFEGTLDDFCLRIKKEGYDGAELWCPSEKTELQALVDTFKKHNLRFGLLIGGGDKDYSKHFEQFKVSLETAAKLQPLYINCHSGRDFFSFDQCKKFIDLTTEVSKASNVPVYHETHRSRIMYSAPVTRKFMDAIPELQLTLDISHWCNVHESWLDDQTETVSLALSRTGHIHARVGHPEGPQVSDPRAPEWKNIVDTHFKWWDAVVEQKKKTGSRLTILTEFGPADYMPTLPYTRQPVSNQWEINVYMLKTLRARYS
jgi:sugar phosphate isomerase/epimerase